MKQRLISRGKIISFIIMLSAMITICFITMNVEASGNDLYETYNETTSESISPQVDLNSVFAFTPISDTECDVRLVDKTATKAIIPEKVDIDGKEYVVTVIAVNGFTSASKLEMVRLPKSVKTIGQNAFANCKALTSLTLPAVETIGANAFSMTKMDYLIIPTCVTSVASTILRGANTKVYVRSVLEEGTTVPEGWVANWNGSNKNQNVEFNSDYIPEVKYEFVSSEIQTFALGDDVDLRNGGYYVTGYQEFCTIDTDDYKEVYIPATHTGTDGVEYPIIGIDSYAFYFNDIDKVTIGYSTTPINLTTESFYGLNGSLITINREVELLSEDFDGNKMISESVFACSTVKTIILPDSLVAIGNNMFDGCENLSDIHFLAPNGTLSSLAEANIAIKLNSTQKVHLPSSVTYIGNSAFALTRNILELYIPNSVEEVGLNIINGWTSNQTVYVDFASDDPILEDWNQHWALGSGNENTARVVYKLSDTEYTITYNIDVQYHNNPNKYVSSQGLTLSPVTMTGYTFAGWYLDENFTTSIENIAIGTTGNLNLYVKMIPNTYMIKYEKNCPSNASNLVLGDMDNSIHTYALSSSISANIYSLKGWMFTGWNTKTDGTGDSYENLASVTTFAESGVKSLYAQWIQKEYEIEYYGNRPNNATSILEGNMTPETHYYEEEFNLKKVTFQLSGWTFTSWNTKADGTGTTYLDEETVSGLTETNIKLYAQWEVTTYTVEYEKNQPSNTEFVVRGAMASSTHIYDVSSFLRMNAFELEGYTFVGWNTKADGSGSAFTNGEAIKSLTANGSIKLFAQWQANTYTIQYKPNRPNSSEQVMGETLSSTHRIDEEGMLSNNGFTLKGWNFIGWNTGADGSGTFYNNKEIVKNVITSSSNIELYAQWEAKTFAIRYEGNVPRLASEDVNGLMDNSNYTVDSTGVLTENDYTLTGWTFTGWNTKADGSGTSYANKAQIKIATDDSIVILYAQWEAKQFSIQYEPNKPANASKEVIGLTRNSTHSDKEHKELVTNGYTLVGWTFTGWNTKADGSGTSYANKAQIKMATDDSIVILYAQWEAKEFFIQYESNKPVNASNSVSGTTNNSTHSDENSTGLKLNGYALKGWTFTGWNTKADGGGTSYADKAQIKIATDDSIVILYAQWKANTYTIVYNANGGVGTMTSTTFIYDVQTNLRQNIFTNSGKHFLKWSINSNGSGVSFNDKENISNVTEINGASITLYAQWEYNDYIVKYMKNKPSYVTSHEVLNTMSESEHKVGSTKALAENQYVFLGWTFAGWNTKADGSGTSYGDKQQVVNLALEDGAVVELYARWMPTQYTIEYISNLPMGNLDRTDNFSETESTTHTYDVIHYLHPYYTLVSWEMVGWEYNQIVYKIDDPIENLTADGGTIQLKAKWKPKENVMNCKNSNNIYEVVSDDQLAGICQGTDKDEFIVMCDIEISENWTPITEFKGILNLNEHTIIYRNSNLDLSSNYGLLSMNNGTIKNGTLKPRLSQNIDSAKENATYIGGVVAENYGNIIDVIVLSGIEEGQDTMSLNLANVDIDARSLNCIIGGIAGLNSGTIQNCINNASLGGAYYIGGIVGKNLENAKINGCTNNGRIWYCSISGDNKCVGGIVGANYQNSEIASCNSNKEIVFAYRNDNSSSDLVYMARIVGWSYVEAKITGNTGLDTPIIIQVDNLSLLQLMYIQNERKLNINFNFNIGKTSTSIDSPHEHSYICKPINGRQHEGVCFCGQVDRLPHIIKYADRNKQYADCKHCGYRLNLKTDMYIVEFGPEDPIIKMPSNEISQIANKNYALVENNKTSEGKDFEVESQD